MVAFMTRKINFDPRHMRFYPEKKTGRDFMNLTQNDIEKHRYDFLSSNLCDIFGGYHNIGSHLGKLY